MKIKIFIIYIFFILTFSNLYSVTVKVYCIESMPYSGILYKKPAGLAIEILNESTNYGAPEFIFNFDVPWIRAQQKILEAGNELVAIAPFSYDKERTNQYQWIAKLFEGQAKLISYDRSAPIKNIKEAQNITIGVVRGHIIISLLKKNGLKKIDDSSKNAEINTLKLLNKRYDTIADGDLICIYNWKLIGQDVKDLQVGPNIGEPVSVYIAGNTGFPVEVAESIKKAIKQMKEDGKFEEIYNRWK